MWSWVLTEFTNKGDQIRRISLNLLLTYSNPLQWSTNSLFDQRHCDTALKTKSLLLIKQLALAYDNKSIKGKKLGCQSRLWLQSFIEVSKYIDLGQIPRGTFFFFFFFFFFIFNNIYSIDNQQSKILTNTTILTLLTIQYLEYNRLRYLLCLQCKDLQYSVLTTLPTHYSHYNALFTSSSN